MTVQTTSLKHAVHPSVRNPKVGKPKTRSEIIVAAMVRDGIMPFKVRVTEFAAIALDRFLRDLFAGWGKSGALSPPDLERGYGSGQPRYCQPEIPTDAQLRASHTFGQLHSWEQMLIKKLNVARETPNYSLTKLGYELYGASNDDQACLQARERIQSLAESILDVHPTLEDWRRVADLNEAKRREQAKRCLDRVPRAAVA